MGPQAAEPDLPGREDRCASRRPPELVDEAKICQLDKGCFCPVSTAKPFTTRQGEADVMPVEIGSSQLEERVREVRAPGGSEVLRVACRQRTERSPWGKHCRPRI